MRIITLMNYTKEPYISMCKGWIYMVKKFHPYAEIIVYYDELDNSIFSNDVIFKKLDMTNVPVLRSHSPHKKVKLAIHKEWSKYDKFIFLDCDAYPLTNLNELYNLNKLVTFCSHEPGEGLGERQLNSGVFFQNNTLFTFKDLIDTWERHNRILKYSGTDQCLVQMTLEDANYYPYDEKMGHEYNSCANAKIMIDREEVKAISNITGKEIKVLHGYDRWKFWTNPYTIEFWEWINERI